MPLTWTIGTPPPCASSLQPSWMTARGSSKPFPTAISKRSPSPSVGTPLGRSVGKLGGEGGREVVDDLLRGAGDEEDAGHDGDADEEDDAECGDEAALGESAGARPRRRLPLPPGRAVPGAGRPGGREPAGTGRVGVLLRGRVRRGLRARVCRGIGAAVRPGDCRGAGRRGWRGLRLRQRLGARHVEHLGLVHRRGPGRRGWRRGRVHGLGRRGHPELLGPLGPVPVALPPVRLQVPSRRCRHASSSIVLRGSVVLGQLRASAAEIAASRAEVQPGARVTAAQARRFAVEEYMWP